jgi:hypothetical protein
MFTDHLYGRGYLAPTVCGIHARREMHFIMLTSKQLARQNIDDLLVVYAL